MKQFLCMLLLAWSLPAQSPQPKSFVGTISGFRPEKLEIEIRPDQGPPAMYEIQVETLAQKIAPGARDLKSASTIKITDVLIGDRVLVTTEPGTQKVLRIVVMPAQDIAQKNDADRREWEKNGVAGIVSAKSGNRITVKTRSGATESAATVMVDEQTAFKRYAPDSVKFAEAKPSRIAEVSVGDQVRARGQKSEDGLQVTAREVIFGTFVIKAGTIVSVNPEAHEVTMEELGSKKPLTVKMTADSQLKQMPSFPGAGGPGRGPMPAGGPPAMPSGGPAGGVPGGRGMGPGGFDINQMLERLPQANLADLKPGTTLIVSSTKGANANQLTAITAIGNADMIIQMASATSDNGRGRGDSGMMGGLGMGGMGGGDLGGLGLSGIIMQ